MKCMTRMRRARAAGAEAAARGVLSARRTQPATPSCAGLGSVFPYGRGPRAACGCSASERRSARGAARRSAPSGGAQVERKHTRPLPSRTAPTQRATPPRCPLVLCHPPGSHPQSLDANTRQRIGSRVYAANAFAPLYLAEALVLHEAAASFSRGPPTQAARCPFRAHSLPPSEGPRGGAPGGAPGGDGREAAVCAACAGAGFARKKRGVPLHKNGRAGSVLGEGPVWSVCARK